MIPSYQLLAQRIREEVTELERSVNRARRAWQATTQAQAEQDMFVDSAALNLHSFYSGLERLFEYIAHQLDGGPPKGDAWHKELLRQMMTDVPGLRPSVISAATSDSLDEFRRFRHVVRNIYAEHLDPERIRLLVEKLPNVWSSLDSELTAFAQFLEGTSQADDEMPE
jgi:hypothetical protein